MRRPLILLILLACSKPMQSQSLPAALPAPAASVPQADDATWLRRVTLDLVGRIPTLGEVRGFLADRDPARRTKVVDRLLASDDYAEHWADVYTELLVGLDVRPPQIGVRFREWLVASLREGK